MWVEFLMTEWKCDVCQVTGIVNEMKYTADDYARRVDAQHKALSPECLMNFYAAEEE